MSKKPSKPLTEEQKARRKYLDEQRRLAKQLPPLLPGMESILYFPPLKGGKNDR